METWLQLEERFKELTAALRYAGLQYQWGAAGTHYNYNGGSISSSREFELVARIAGEKLGSLDGEQLHPDVLAPSDSIDRWYEALRHHSGLFELGLYGIQQDADGSNQGAIYTGTISEPARASAVVALWCSTLRERQIAAPPGPPMHWSARLNAWLAREREQRGVLWAVLVGLVTLLLGVLALA